MFGSEVIDVGIGMALLFLFMSLIATALREIIENFAKTRSKDLEKGIQELLFTSGGSSSSLIAKFYTHPVIAALYKGKYVAGGRELPSYIPRQSFSLALLDIVAEASETGTPLSIESLQNALQQNKNPNAVQRIVLMALGTASGDLDRVRSALEDWYDGTMDRVSGWYVRRTGRILGVIGFGAAVFFNVDAITVAQHLIQDKTLRQAVVAEAGHYVESVDVPPKYGTAPASSSLETLPSSLGNVETLKSKLDEIGFPIGWKFQDNWIHPAPQTCKSVGTLSHGPEQDTKCEGAAGWIKAFFGWIITALAIMLGAPFWFDVLNKFIVVRSTVKPKEKSPDESSADAQSSSAAPPPTRPSTPARPTDPDPKAAVELLGASMTAALAVSEGVFEPHQWANNPNPQAGVM